jgi:hypothetical protein
LSIPPQGERAEYQNGFFLIIGHDDDGDEKEGMFTYEQFTVAAN